MNRKEIREGIRLYFLGETTGEERSRLARAVEKDPESREYLLQMLDLHGNLGKTFRDLELAGKGRPRKKKMRSRLAGSLQERASQSAAPWRLCGAFLGTAFLLVMFSLWFLPVGTGDETVSTRHEGSKVVSLPPRELMKTAGVPGKPGTIEAPENRRETEEPEAPLLPSLPSAARKIVHAPEKSEPSVFVETANKETPPSREPEAVSAPSESHSVPSKEISLSPRSSATRQEIGRLVSLDGTALVVRDGRETDVREGTPVVLDSSLRVDRGMAFLHLHDGTGVSLFSRGRIRFGSAPLSSTGPSPDVSLSLEEGGIRVLAGKKGVLLKTAGGWSDLRECAVRADVTDMSVHFLTDVGRPVFNVEDRFGREKKLRVDAGHLVRVHPGSRPLLTLQPQYRASPHPSVDALRVERTLEAGARWLSSSVRDGEWRELVLLALHRIGGWEEHPLFRSWLRETLAADQAKTYRVALEAVLLSEMDPDAFRWRIARCGRFLVDNQCENGQWCYGHPVSVPDHPDFRSPGQEGGPVRLSGKIMLNRRPVERKSSGCNTASFFAQMGLNACIRAGVFPPRETMELSREAWESLQRTDGGWGYGTRYSPLKDSYASTTVGGVGALFLLDSHLGNSSSSRRAMTRGVRWLNQDFSVERNVGRPLGIQGKGWHTTSPHRSYQLFVLETAAGSAGWDLLGRHDWYRAGCEWLLDQQKASGCWYFGDAPEYPGAILDTAFSMLFLRRGTPPVGWKGFSR